MVGVPAASPLMHVQTPAARAIMLPLASGEKLTPLPEVGHGNCNANGNRHRDTSWRRFGGPCYQCSQILARCTITPAHDSAGRHS
jgi:hypothetical protein